MRTIFALTTLSATLALVGCGGSSNSAITVITGTAATGTAIGNNLNGSVTIKDSSSPPRLASTPTDAAGNYTFTTAQIAGMLPPYMLEVSYKIGGLNYYLTSAVTTQDLIYNGAAIVNITPLTDLVIANLADQSANLAGQQMATTAAAVFTNGNFSNILNSGDMIADATALATQLQPLFTQQGIAGAVDLLHQIFTASATANGTGLDGALDTLQVTVDPITLTARITNRLNGASISESLTTLFDSTTTLPTSTVPLADLQAISADFMAFSSEMAAAPAATAPALLAFFDQTNFLQDGQTLGAYLAQITAPPTVAGTTLAFTNITLDTVPTWVTLPSGATASYKVTFTAVQDGSPTRAEMIVYKAASGAWLMLGNQQIAAAEMLPLETRSPAGVSTNYCTGLYPKIANKGGTVNIGYATVTGNGLPVGGLLLFNSGNGTTDTAEFRIAAGDVTTYAGPNTTPLATNVASCGFSSLYPLTDADVGTIAAGDTYTVNLYDDHGTGSTSGASLLATYTVSIPAAPLLSGTQVGAALFPTGVVAPIDSQLLSAVNSASSSQNISWIAPAASGLYANSININIITSPTVSQFVSANLAADAANATLTLPQVPGATSVSLGIDYVDSSFRNYWANY